MKRSTPFVCALLMVAAVGAQQERGRVPRFDVASIKEVTPSADLVARRASCLLPPIERSGNRVRIAITQFCGLIRVAYDVGEFQVVRIPQNQGIGDVDFFAVDAVADRADPPSMDDVRSMMRTLLAERFQLQVSREPVEMPVYLLVAAEGGPKQTTCSDPKASSVYAPGRIVSCAPPLPMARVAQFLSRETGRYVMDKTGLAPSSFELHWQPETAPPIADSLPSLFTAIREQLGLKLEAQRAAVESVVVNHAERPSPN